jgi:H+-translocating NAD(P) transhydrogenase subunit alpha
MRIGVPIEGGEERLVAVAPANVSKLVKLGYDVIVESGAGSKAQYDDKAYQEAGAQIGTESEVWGSDVVVKVRAQNSPATAQPNQYLIAQLAPGSNPELVENLRKSGVSALAMDAIPRISRAQSMDVLSSMSNLSGYRAVIEAANEYQGMFGGQVTAAGKTDPAKVFIIGGGVAGLAAIGTAVSLGAQVRAFDVRPEAGEQIESMGATFVSAEGASQGVSSDGYASELSESQEQATARLYAEQAEWADVVITTALVRGRAPRTITSAMVEKMRPGSVIVDLAASGGGNCEATVPGQRIVTPNGVTVLGYTDLAARMPAQASQLFGSNIVNLMTLLTPGKDGELVLDLNDPVQRGMTVAHARETLWPPPPVEVSAAGSGSPMPDANAAPVLTAEQQAALAEAKALEVAAAARRKAMRLLVGMALAGVLVMLMLTFAPPLLLANFTVFALAIVVGFYVINGVSHSLHTPLMAQTNAISGIILVGALLMLGSANLVVTILAFIAATVASINIFGGFLVSRRMIAMFQKN